ncbi:thioredoxin domain-containing protein [Paralimibaculum aggregatum]|uniref:Thioredoxin domain-containing protein n=1 Tax=Paralimibaculum aggregatum TaxID=3036245 RepID=A0ABQ6LNT5_9RHOB|nr:thioredoxin domain-containing protein [Limibaculum sp. NKW23]GMG82888.1 thioredoxin domain-containing protein [Limibaculum sp. NKW23]
MAITPPSVTRSPALTADLEAALAAQGPDYAPRTHLLEPDGKPRYVNRLIREASPYLLQHAHNPVDWHPWGEEAMAAAAGRDCPIFLSVGYATCHWCHVMEEESFDDEEIAAVLNARFVPVKLDREARPDLDQIYITATQLQQGHAGWPNSLWLMPDGTPFHTGTYFPKHQFLQVLAAVADAWDRQRPQIVEVAGRIAEAVRRQGALGGSGAAALEPETFDAAAAHLARMHNRAHGGFSDNQQFPQESFLLFLLDRWRREGDAEALGIARKTLDAIAAGGIHDHAGGGFHRYTVDINWRTPHFEKMLYNQGQLARAFTEGWEATGEPAWRRAAERCFAYVLRDMTDGAGAFFAAEDADSLDAAGRREEGAFYLWPAAEARELLGAEGDWAAATLGLGKPVGEVGPVAHLEPGAAVDFARLDPLLERLRAAREARHRPIRDEKVIAGWNGLMIRALAEAAVAFDRRDLAEAAARAAEAVWSRLWDGTRLARLWAGGAAREAGQLEDHVWMGLACLALAEADAFLAVPGPWAERAEALGATILRDFSDGAGRLRMAAEDGPLGPIYESSDGATPAGESAALELLARLGARGDMAAGAAAQRLVSAVSGPMREIPVLRTEALIGARVLAAGPSVLRRTLAGGTVAARLLRGGAAWELELAIAPGWHVNAPDPGTEGLTGAAIEGAGAAWPEPLSRSLGFAGAPLNVYEGRVRVPLSAPSDSIVLHLQPCSDTLCREPVAARFRLGARETER